MRRAEEQVQYSAQMAEEQAHKKTAEREAEANRRYTELAARSPNPDEFKIVDYEQLRSTSQRFWRAQRKCQLISTAFSPHYNNGRKSETARDDEPNEQKPSTHRHASSGIAPRQRSTAWRND